MYYSELLQEIMLERERVPFTNNPDTWVYRASLHHLQISNSTSALSSMSLQEVLLDPLLDTLRVLKPRRRLLSSAISVT